MDAASAVAFRVAFGVLMCMGVLRFFAHGWIEEYYLKPRFFFPYYGFEWIRPWPGIGMYIHFAVMGVLAVMVASGAFYRVSVALFGALFAYAHLIDKTNYLNHYYLLICLSFLMAFLPLHRTASVDAWWRPKLHTSFIPAWALWALRAQVGLVYFFGGVAKLKSDWLIHAQPMKIWLFANADFPYVGHLFEKAWVAYAFSYAGALFDLTVVGFLLWKRSRLFAYIAVVIFHLITARLFQLGLFPWLMMASSLIFFPPDWPRRLLSKLRVSWRAVSVAPRETTPTWAQRAVAGMLAFYFVVHALMPLRHFLYPGNLSWTEEGFRFSWNVMLMEKNGSTDFHVREPSTGRQWEVLPAEYLTRYQAKMMATQPDMVLAFAHLLADEFCKRGVVNPEVRVDAFVSLNGRQLARLIAPDVDLAQESDGFRAKKWILPAPESLPP